MKWKKYDDTSLMAVAVPQEEMEESDDLINLLCWTK